MRKQYHFWPADQGMDAWDVDRLIELTRDLPTEEVEIDTIGEIDTIYWFHETHPPTVRAVVEHVRYIGDADLAYPIILGPDGRVMDGMHRVARALLEGRTTLTAVRFPELPVADYFDVLPEELPYDR